MQTGRLRRCVSWKIRLFSGYLACYQWPSLTVMKPPTPRNEARRLKVLWQYDVLDTVPEEMFDDLTDLAANICHAPISMISLVDDDRQWFKSSRGLNERETHRDLSFCAHAICQPGLFVVGNAARDSRFKRNPLVTGSAGVRFYAGAPLVTPDGHALGTLCVLDTVPRKLSVSQQRALGLLARVVMNLLELRSHSRELARLKSDGRTTRGARARRRPAGARAKRPSRRRA